MIAPIRFSKTLLSLIQVADEPFGVPLACPLGRGRALANEAYIYIYIVSISLFFSLSLSIYLSIYLSLYLSISLPLSLYINTNKQLNKQQRFGGGAREVEAQLDLSLRGAAPIHPGNDNSHIMYTSMDRRLSLTCIFINY